MNDKQQIRQFFQVSSQHYNSYVDWISVNNNVDHLSNGTSGALFGHVWS